jgi:hypothetical protein
MKLPRLGSFLSLVLFACFAPRLASLGAVVGKTSDDCRGSYGAPRFGAISAARASLLGTVLTPPAVAADAGVSIGETA